MHTSSSLVSRGAGAIEAQPARVIVVRTVRRGAELVGVKGSVRLDADVYLVAEGTAPSVLAREPHTQSLAVELTVPLGTGTGSFLPALRSTRGPVGERLRELAQGERRDVRIALGSSDAADWLARLDDEERALKARAARIRCVKPATRDALFRRLLRSADFIQTHYGQPLNVEVLAAASHLSTFHFARLFALVMDETPHAFLMRKRLAVAHRLLASGLGQRDTAERAGFGSRSTLFRHLRDAAATPS